jgi:hypothetical protein
MWRDDFRRGIDCFVIQLKQGAGCEFLRKNVVIVFSLSFDGFSLGRRSGFGGESE